MTDQIKSIAHKASIVAANAKILELEKALEAKENRGLKKYGKTPPEDSDDDRDLDPLHHEVQATVSQLHKGSLVNRLLLCRV